MPLPPRVPVAMGYVATKTHFGRAWRMSIEAGEVGPVFKVTDIVSGRCYEGETPTKPWTAACVATRTRTRISGPLFFGFSDPATMRALAHLYTREEIHACKTGERVQVKVRGVRASSEPTLDAITDAVGAERVFDPAPPEKDSAGASDAGRESARLERFVGAIRRDVEGCGYQAALALARTRSLSRHVDAPRAEPRRLVDVAELRSVPSEALRAFLLESEEVPAATRRWPAWRLRVAETIVRALAAGDDEGAEGDSIDEEDIKEGDTARAGEGERRRGVASAVISIDERDDRRERALPTRPTECLTDGNGPGSRESTVPASLASRRLVARRGGYSARARVRAQTDAAAYHVEREPLE